MFFYIEQWISRMDCGLTLEEVSSTCAKPSEPVKNKVNSTGISNLSYLERSQGKVELM